ncbi:MAG: UDP-2,3-diacylglucosamine diphosphatase [Wenzhouxiangellaceae bacterium]|nr:MAG: UDP-2,3-diacylglucosamine diphosphatase [Wenzhouxiangellaceae bacterium]
MYLISDLHLEAGRPEITDLLLDFLAGPASRARALFILGDLFEAWIGDDAADEPARRVACALAELSNRGVDIHFLPGNRDFLLGDQYCARAGMQRIAEPHILKDCQPPALLMHGDILCTDDLAYQRFRRKVRNPAWQARVLSRPIWWRRLLARIARFISKRQGQTKPTEVMDVNDDAVQRCFQEHGVSLLIHGHTHRPAVHHLKLGKQSLRRIVLGDWHETRGSVLRLKDGQADLLVLERKPDGQLTLQTAA